MDIGDFKVGIQDGILILERLDKRTPTLVDIRDIISAFEENTGKIYNYAIYKSALGYYFGFDFKEDKYVFCQSLNVAYNIKKMNDYINKTPKIEEEWFGYLVTHIMPILTFAKVFPNGKIFLVVENLLLLK